jgi:hypothetical protein
MQQTANVSSDMSANSLAGGEGCGKAAAARVLDPGAGARDAATEQANLDRAIRHDNLIQCGDSGAS